MPEKDRVPGQTEDSGAGQPGLSRRRMLGATGAGAAGLAAGALGAAAPALAANRPDKDERPTEGQDRVAADEPVVVHVPNAYSGDVDVYHGTSHTKLHDPALAAKLRRSAK